MNLKELQEELNRINLAEEVIVPVGQYRELVKDAMRAIVLKDMLVNNLGNIHFLWPGVFEKDDTMLNDCLDRLSIKQ